MGGPEQQEADEARGANFLQAEGGGMEDGVLWGTTINVQTCVNVFKYVPLMLCNTVAYS